MCFTDVEGVVIRRADQDIRKNLLILVTAKILKHPLVVDVFQKPPADLCIRCLHNVPGMPLIETDRFQKLVHIRKIEVQEVLEVDRPDA